MCKTGSGGEQARVGLRLVGDPNAISPDRATACTDCADARGCGFWAAAGTQVGGKAI